jgi:hypothetical protein
MKRPTWITITLAVPLMMAGALTAAFAHETTQRTPEAWQVEQRLLISDSDTGDIVVLDDGVVRERLSTPPSPISLARSDDGHLVFTIRGRNTDVDHVTIIDTAYDESTGAAARPYVARTWATASAGGVHDGHLPEVRGKIGLSMEATGALQLLDPAAVSGLRSADAGAIRLGQPGHYTFVTVTAADGSELLHAGSTAGNTAVIDTASGQTIASDGRCPGLHGGAASTTGATVFFACSTGILVAPADPTTGTAALIPYPTKDRDGSVYAGATNAAGHDVLWATNGAKTSVDRIDLNGDQVTITAVPLNVGRSVRNELATAVDADSGRLYVVTYQGYLQVRDAVTGMLLRERRVMPPMSIDDDETTSKAINPDIAVASDRIYLSVPVTGTVLSVSLDGRRILRATRVGGEPTRLVLLEHS